LDALYDFNDISITYKKRKKKKRVSWRSMSRFYHFSILLMPVFIGHTIC